MATYEQAQNQLQGNLDQVAFDRLIEQLIRQAERQFSGGDRFEQRALQDYINEVAGRSTGVQHEGVKAEKHQLKGLQPPTSEADIQARIDELIKPEQFYTEQMQREPTARELDQGRPSTGTTTRRVANPDYQQQMDDYNAQVRDIRQGAGGVPTVDPRESMRTGGTATTEAGAQDAFAKEVLQDEIARRSGDARTQMRQGMIEDYMARDRFQLGPGNMDAIIQNLLNEQQAMAEANVNARYNRGDLNDAGLEEAMRRLGLQRTAAESDIGKIASTTLDTANQALYDFGQGVKPGDRKFDMKDFKSGFKDQYNRQASGLEGALMSNIGGAQFFNPGTAVSRAGAMTGPTSVRDRQGYFAGGGY